MNAALLQSPPGGAPCATQKGWRLLAPDWAELDSVWRNAAPFVLWPVGPQPLLAHWMDEAVRRGVAAIELYIADRPAEVRAWLEEAAYWSRRVQLIVIRTEAEAPKDAERMDHLPGLPAVPLPMTAAALPAYWFELQKQWLGQRSQEAITIDHLHPSGGWVGPQAQIHPRAKLTAPFWIGARAQIGDGCEIGPNALIAEGAILHQNVAVEEACVLPRTYLGTNTRLFQCAATGSVLLDFRRACRAEIEDSFIMHPVAEHSSRPRPFARLVALLCWMLLFPVGRYFLRHSPESRTVRGCSGKKMILRTGRSGPLWCCRIPWLWQIAVGRLRWVGVLPRSDEERARLPLEIAHAFHDAPPGMFSLADVYGCHDPSDPEEWIHAAFQASEAGEDARFVVIRNLWKILWSPRT